jgi:hypothetical protein
MSSWHSVQLIKHRGNFACTYKRQCCVGYESVATVLWKPPSSRMWHLVLEVHRRFGAFIEQHFVLKRGSRMWHLVLEVHPRFGAFIEQHFVLKRGSRMWHLVLEVHRRFGAFIDQLFVLKRFTDVTPCSRSPPTFRSIHRSALRIKEVRGSISPRRPYILTPQSVEQQQFPLRYL